MIQPSRREVLQKISLGAGATLLTPILGQIQAASEGKPAPRRFVFIMEGNGLPPQQIMPPEIKLKRGAHGESLVTELIDKPSAEYTFPAWLEPLRPAKDRITLLHGLSGKVCGGGHSTNFGALGVFNAGGSPGSNGTPKGETLDQRLGRALPSIFNQIALGISDKPDDTVVYNCSATGPGRPAPTQCRPDLAYHALFGSAAPGAGQQAFVSRRNLLDFMIDDVKRVENELTGSERDKLGHYLQAFEAMKERQSRLNEIKHTLRDKGPVASDKFTSLVETDRLDAQFDIGTAALICGLTNVLVLASGVGDIHFSVRFKGLGINLDKHSIGHGQSYDGKNASELMVTIRKFHFELIARMMDKLKAIPEGNGTMLDNTLIVYLSDAADEHHTRCNEWPMVLIGDLGGKLKTGRLLVYPGYARKGHRTIANLYTTFLNLAGAPVEHFGLMDPNLRDFDQKGPLQELLA